VLATPVLHGDDTPLPVLAPGTGKTATGRLSSYVRDERPAGGDTAPAVWFAYSPDRKGIHPRQHLASFTAVLQADAYAGFGALYQTGRITHAACSAHYLECGFVWSRQRVMRRWCWLRPRRSPHKSRLVTATAGTRASQAMVASA
jgi:hypothetical protein